VCRAGIKIAWVWRSIKRLFLQPEEFQKGGVLRIFLGTGTQDGALLRGRLRLDILVHAQDCLVRLALPDFR
jgi:hypothetical protein